MYNKIKNINLDKKFAFNEDPAIFARIKGMINIKLRCKSSFKELLIYVNLNVSLVIDKKLNRDLNFESLFL